MPTMSPDQLIASGPNTTPDAPARAAEFTPIPTTSNVAAEPPAPAPDAPVAPKTGDGDSVADTLAAFDKLMSKPQDKLPTKPSELVKVEAPEPVFNNEPPTAKRNEKVIIPADDVALIPPDIFKQMSNPAKEWAVAQAKKARDFEASAKSATEAATKAKEGGLPDSWYEHPNAYVLMPAFQQTQANVQEFSGLYQHYRQQLVAIKEGEKWKDVVQSKDGSRHIVERDPSAQAEELVMDRIGTAKAALAEEEKYMQQIVTDFTGRHQQVKSTLNRLENRYFPQYEKEVKGSTKEIDNYIAGFKGDLGHLNLDNDKLANTTLKLYAFCMEQMVELNALKAAGATSNVTAQVQRNAGPTASVVNSGGSSRALDPDNIPFNPSQWSMR